MKRIAVVSKSRCPLLLARGVSACLWFFLPLNREGKTVVGAVGKWESRVFCGIPKRSVFSTACWPLLLVGKQAHPVRPVVHTQPSGQMLAHQHPASRQRPAPARALDLQNAIGEADGVVAVDHPLVLQRENTLQLFPTRGHKSALRLRCPHRKLAVEFRNVLSRRNRLASSRVVIPRSRNSCGKRRCQVPKFRSLLPRACGEYAGIIATPSSRRARPTWVSRCRSTISPAFAVSQKWLARSLYK